MTVETDNELEHLKTIGHIVALARDEMARHVQPGITTAELDAIGEQVLKEHGAESAPILTYDYPGWTCISVNDQAAHGIPGKRVVQEGDLVNIDVSAARDGYYADTARTVMVGEVEEVKRRLVECALLARERGLKTVRAGRPINGIAKAFERTAREFGFTIIRDLPSHGIGRSLHEEPTIPGFFSPQFRQPLRKGQVITVEPFISNGARHIHTEPDGWTLTTPHGQFCAQFEHTVVVTNGRPIILTEI